MPKRRPVQSLQKLCLENVAEHMERVWVKDYTINEYLEVYHCRYAVGPFSMLDHQRLTSALLYSLLLPQLTELDLSTCSKLVSRTTAHVISVRCKNLSSLVLHGCDHIPADVLADLVGGLPCLVRLDLSNTKCDTSVLSTIRSRCWRLQELNISGCVRLSPESLLHLAYDPDTHSVCCPFLRRLNIDGLDPTTNKEDLVWALVFVLLALPCLKCVVHDYVAEAIHLIHDQQFEGAPIPPQFPSLVKLAECRRAAYSNKGSSSLVLDLTQIYYVPVCALPKIHAVCPYLSEICMALSRNLGFHPSFLPWHHLTRLTVHLVEVRDLQELLPVTQSLGPQLQSLALDGFSLEDKLSFHTLLSHCQHLEELRASFHSPTKATAQPTTEAFDWALTLPDCSFPQLSDLVLVHSDVNALPWQHVAMLRQCIVALLRGSPHLESVCLASLPFSLDDVFQDALMPPGTSLRHLYRLSLVEAEVSPQTIGLLLSSKNELTYLELDSCFDISEAEYSKLLQHIHQKRLDVQLTWK
ncbi:hypothetical protein JRQ81_003497 [Phrynocephalus forsythii]|uniref:F-box/LRR-repeat protein 2 n=1 Tax=Phrynocephalus forsythii TaxID=171643 RepID=A0A9Q0XLU5_9SAUR|nr:hypothetical protein JRQ81_003497 [Phrynocephalus forsythii]